MRWEKKKKKRKHKKTNRKKFQIIIKKQGHVIANFGPVAEEYKLIFPPLGEGAFGQVRKAVHKQTGLERAIKVIYKEKLKQSDIEKLIDEVIFFLNLR